MRWLFNAPPRPLYPREEKTVPSVQKDGLALVLVWMGVENLASIRFRFSEPPARSELLYRLSLPSPRRMKLSLI